MLHPIQVELNHIKDRMRNDVFKCPVKYNLAEKYLVILKISEFQRHRRLRNVQQTLSYLELLKTGHRQAEHFLLEIDIPGAKPQHVLQHMKSILQLVGLEFHAEIVQIEAQHPQLRANFACEEEEYRLQWNRYIEQYKLNDKERENESLPVRKRTRTKRQSTKAAHRSENNY